MVYIINIHPLRAGPPTELSFSGTRVEVCVNRLFPIPRLELILIR